MKECAYCKEKFVHYDTVRVNHGIEGREFRLCHSCLEDACNNGKIIGCEDCGEYFTADVLHDEEVNGHSFTECPVCHKDVVDCMTREEFVEEYRLDRFAVIVRYFRGEQRGYIVCANDRNEAMKKLLDKVNMIAVAEVTIAEVLLDGDEF